MSNSASFLENNFNDTINDADDISTNKRSTAKTYDCVQECESLKEFKRTVENLHSDNVPWNFHSCKKSIYFTVKNGETNGPVYFSDNQHSNHSNDENSTDPLHTKEKKLHFRSLGQIKKIIDLIVD
ncbi:hypothetical protein BpHYR1_030029 [Brachionus plicatilis]|uniref:Uncharacterized protein n=1 Tax=Brachionus plicatilis TaxID=10195 RepID=A0A3M7S334_BRAPC|nr:hypothetical protein BpHYR1_030029 [Brachionus plicatilis]